MPARPPTSGCVLAKSAVGTIPAPVHNDDDVRRWFASHVVAGTALWLAIDAADTPVGILVLDGESVDQLYVEPNDDRTGHRRAARAHSKAGASRGPAALDVRLERPS